MNYCNYSRILKNILQSTQPLKESLRISVFGGNCTMAISPYNKKVIHHGNYKASKQ
jgi:hypothetical protein